MRRDYNQCIGSNNFKQFDKEIEVHKIFPIMNDAPANQIGPTYEHGSKTIDSIVAIIGLINYADRCKIIECKEIVESDYKGYIIDLAMEDYFSSEISNWDNLNEVMLNLVYCSHRETFAESLEEQLQIYALEHNL